MTPFEYIAAARVPKTVNPKTFGPWQIERLVAGGQVVNGHQKAMHERMVGFPDYTLLRHRRFAEQDECGHRFACEMEVPGEIVMEDSVVELSKHLPIWMAARGSVLVTGLGLGCVVRGLLANPRVDHITVVEKCPYIIGEIGPELWSNPRVAVRLEDALEYRPDRRFDFAWHDLWKEGDGLQLLHARLITRLRNKVGRQGAWAFPRTFAKLWARRGHQLLGAPSR